MKKQIGNWFKYMFIVDTDISCFQFWFFEDNKILFRSVHVSVRGKIPSNFKRGSDGVSIYKLAICFEEKDKRKYRVRTLSHDCFPLISVLQYSALFIISSLIFPMGLVGASPSARRRNEMSRIVRGWWERGGHTLDWSPILFGETVYRVGASEKATADAATGERKTEREKKR